MLQKFIKVHQQIDFLKSEIEYKIKSWRHYTLIYPSTYVIQDSYVKMKLSQISI